MNEYKSFSDAGGNLLAYKDGDNIRLYDHEYNELKLALLLDWLCAASGHYPLPPPPGGDHG